MKRLYPALLRRGIRMNLVINVNEPTAATSSPPDTFSINGGFALDVARRVDHLHKHNFGLQSLSKQPPSRYGPELEHADKRHLPGNYTFKP